MLCYSSETLGQPDKLTFEDVGELLEIFEDFLPEEEKETAQRIRRAMDGKGQYQGTNLLFFFGKGRG